MEKQGEARGGGGGRGEYGKLSAPSASSLKLFLSQPVMTILSYRPMKETLPLIIETPIKLLPAEVLAVGRSSVSY